MGRNCVGPIVRQHYLLGESEAVDKHSYWMILSRNGRIKWRYTAASKTGQSCSNIQLLNEDEASLNQLGNDTSCYGGERGVDKLQEYLMLSGRDTQLLMKDKDCPNQSDGDTEVLNGDEMDLDESGCNTNH
ncbi:unnamed protein product [Microthlaspi erraticum]|uniref:Uncharacterized protein n=1 Tax=Microthlaspi erraticum TaxID=1685480 RepID=A0A6D2KLV6_9BRAS|nr:unnamed protein product [Microthlaspi erraticum]